MVSKLLKYVAIIAGAVGVGAVIYYVFVKPVSGLRARTGLQVKTLSPEKFTVGVNGTVIAANPDVAYFDLSFYYSLYGGPVVGFGPRTFVTGMNWANPEEGNPPHQGLPPKVGESREFTYTWTPPGPGTYMLEARLYMKNYLPGGDIGQLDIWSDPVTVTVAEIGAVPQGTVNILVT